MPAALLIVDMQNYFFATPEKRAVYTRLVASVNELIAAFDRAKCPIFHVISVHKPDRSTWSRNMLRGGIGCLLEGSDEARIVDGLAVASAHAVVRKTRHSAFMRTNLESLLQARGVKRVAVCGVYTHGCIALTAVDAWSLDFDVAVAAEAVASHRPDIATFCTERLQSMFQIPFLTNAALVGTWLA